jgi:hypothetical protein
LVCNDFEVGRVVEKSGYGIAGGYITDGMLHSSINFPPGANLTYGHKNVAVMICA